MSRKPKGWKKKCYRFGCRNIGVECYQDKESVCYLSPVCAEHQSNYVGKKNN